MGLKVQLISFLPVQVFMNGRQRYLPGNLENFTAKELHFGKGNTTEQDNQPQVIQIYLNCQACYIFYIPIMIGAQSILYIICLYLFVYFILTSLRDSGTSSRCAWVSLCARATD